jgi:hypothetical protein
MRESGKWWNHRDSTDLKRLGSRSVAIILKAFQTKVLSDAILGMTRTALPEVEHTAGGGHSEAGAVLPGGQRQPEVRHQQALTDFWFVAEKQNALGRQESWFDPAGRRRRGLLGEQRASDSTAASREFLATLSFTAAPRMWHPARWLR